MNTLWFGDNLDVMRRHVKDESVDLVYLDPPFNSKANYNVVFKAPSGRGHRAQIQAFEDTWHWGDEAEETYDELMSKGGSLASMMRALHAMLGRSDLMAYLVMMAIRLSEMHRVLKSTGSLYLHCDPTTSHYLKIVMDAVFSRERFLSEIIWKRSSAHSSAKRYAPVHDVILLYSKSEKYTWNQVCQPIPIETVEAWYNNIEAGTERRYNRADLTAPGTRTGSSGAIWRDIDVTAKGRHWAIPGFLKLEAKETSAALDELDASGRLHWPKMKGGVPMLKRYLDESPGIPALDTVTDIQPLNNSTKERLGYPTQKPVALLERFLAASSNIGDVVLDPFCGCGTTVHAAQKLGRAWIGIDVTHVAIQVIADRLGRWMPHAKFKIEGQPVDLAGAIKLAEIDKYQFQWWATWLCGGQPAQEGRKGRDLGIDGTLEFVSRRGEHDWGVISVKGGKTVGPAPVRELLGTIEREKAPIGVLICLATPTRDMEREAVSAGFITLGGERYRRIQIRTIEQLFAGEAIDCPYLLTTVQAPPGRANGGSKRVAVSPLELQKQRSFLYPLQGGQQVASPDLFGQAPVEVVRRRRA